MVKRSLARFQQGRFEISEIVIGMVIIVTAVVLFVVFAMNGKESVAVVATKTPMQVGHVIDASELVATSVPVGVAQLYFSVEQAQEVVGQVMSQAVTQSGPLPQSAVSRVDMSLKPQEALTAVSLNQGSFPPHLAVGNAVRIVVTPAADGSGGAVKTLTEVVVVHDITQASDVQQNTVVTLRGSVALAEQIAASGPVHLSIVAVPS
ncbi:MAG: hypothetical protein EXQ63_08940 [Ilumatobacteraceae bacterium]|nr:hypothetical protein [Ilumatobacteraceae bacterium]